MADYTGIKCPVCDKPFQPGDDIVVCPQCGAPYHRECYQQEGKCKFDDLHAEEKPGSRRLLPSTLTPAQKSRIRNVPIAANSMPTAPFSATSVVLLFPATQPNIKIKTRILPARTLTPVLKTLAIPSRAALRFPAAVWAVLPCPLRWTPWAALLPQN